MQIDDIRRIFVLGSGRMGTEIALQCAIAGYEAVLYDVSADALAGAAKWHDYHLNEFLRDGRLTADECQAVRSRICPSTNIADAADVDIVSESVPENLRLKRDLFGRLHGICPPRTVFTTNTSYLQPSQIAGHVGRPERFAALHFHPPVWKANVVDIMPHEGTSPEVVELLRQFAGRIGQIPIVCTQQGQGYIFNTMLRTWLLTAVQLAESGIAGFEDIDRSWMGVMQSKVGPFGVLDNIGLDTVTDIVNFWGMVLRDPQAKKSAAFLKPYIDAGRLGVKTMKGFYDYPDATYLQPDFLTKFLSEAMPADSLIRRFTLGRGRMAAKNAAAVESQGAAHLSDAPQRYLLRATTALVSPKLKHAIRFQGPCLVVGDNPTSQALRSKLEQAGGIVTVITYERSLSETLARIEDLWREHAFPHLFLMTARDDDASTQWEHAWWLHRQQRGALLPFYACQKWYAEVMKRGIHETATLVGATALGGDFGISGRVHSAEGGGIAGLLKAVYLESNIRSSLGPQVKVVDFPAEQSPDVAAEQICRELALAQAAVVTGSHDEARRRYAGLEVGYLKGVRHHLQLEPVSADASAGADDWAIPPGSTWVVTGGARGITAFVARELGRRFKLRLHLLGTTPLAEVDVAAMSEEELARYEAEVKASAATAGGDAERAWSRLRKSIDVQRSLKEFSDNGVRATYHACDVTDFAQLSATLDRVRRQDGPIGGVLHGAGLEIGARLPDKKPADVEATLAVKATGMAALMELTRHDPLQWFLAFGSLSGRFGNLAQSDYSMANELIAKQLVWLRAQRPECRCTIFHWPGWADVGMAAAGEGKDALRRGHHTFLDPQQGLQHILNELMQETPAAEVVVIHRNEVPAEMRIAASSGSKRAPTWQG